MRRAAALLMVVLTALLLAGAAIAWYADTTLVDDEEFATRVTSSLGDADVRRVVADQIVTGLTSSAVPNALVVRPLLVPLVSAVADSPVFRRVVHRALASRHRALVRGDTSFSFGLPISEGTLFEGIRRVAPTVARRIPEDLTVPVLRLDPKGFELTAAHVLVSLASWRWPLVVAALVAALGAALLAGGLRGALVHVGLAIAGGGLLVAAVVAGLGEFVAAHAAHAANLDEDAERDAIRAVWSALFGDLRSAALIAALGGALLAAIASVALPAVDPGAGWRWVRGAALSSSRTARTLRAAVLIAAGAGIVFEPALLGRIAVAAGGVLVVILGLAQLSGTPEPREEAVASVAGGARPRPKPLAPAAAVVLVVVATGLAMAIVLPGPRIAPVAVVGEPGGCNGLRAMCDRRLDQVVMAGTHNSYAAADEPGWLFANQRFGIARQLRDGIRALLIDVHLGAPDSEERAHPDRPGGRGIGPQQGRARAQPRRAAHRRPPRRQGGCGQTRRAAPAVSLPHAVRARGRAARRAADDHPPLPHRQPAGGGRAVRGALRPGRDDRGLAPRDGPAVGGPVIDPDEPLPTLGELIDADTRMVVLAEQDGGERPWYLDGFRFVQDTPLGATRPSQLSCDRFRGEPDSPLLMLNHWIPPFPPSVTRNQAIGGPFLRARIGRCERQREMLPNLLAVDFYERTGVVGIARDLNAEQP